MKFFGGSSLYILIFFKTFYELMLLSALFSAPRLIYNALVRKKYIFTMSNIKLNYTHSCQIHGHL